MKKLLLLIFLFAVPVFAQSWSGQSSSDARVVPPYRFCVGSDNGTDVCLSNTAANVAKVINGSLDFALVPLTVSQLPAAASNAGRVYRVTDGVSASDCTVGGSSTSAICTSNGSTWVTLGSSGGSSSVGSQYALQLGDGAGNFLATNVPATPGSFPCGYSPTTSAAVAPNCLQAGLANRALTGTATSDTVLFSDNLQIIEHDDAASGAVNETLPTATTLQNASFAYSYSNHSAQTDTITPTTWTIQQGTAAAAASISVLPGYVCRISVDPNSSTNWLSDCYGPSGGGLSGMTATQVAIAGSPATITSSKALAGAGAGVTTGPASGVTTLDVAEFTGTGGQIADAGILAANLVTASSPGVGLCHFAGSTQACTSSTVATADIAANAVPSAKMAVVNTRRVCDIPVGDTSASALSNAQLGPQKRICYIPAAATIVEMDVAADGGTPNVIVAVNHAGSNSNIVSSALATASAGGIACSNTGGTTGIDGATTCSSTLQNTSMAAGDYLELVSGTAGGTAKLMTIHVVYTIN